MLIGVKGASLELSLRMIRDNVNVFVLILSVV